MHPLVRLSSPRLAFCGLLAWSLIQPAAALPGAGIKAEDIQFFETHIRPALITECIDCHGPEKQKGGLRLDSKQGWQKGGDTGAAIIPGDPDASLLMRSIRHLEPELKMPEKAPKLDESTLRHFSHWIELGAPDPRETPGDASALKPSWPQLLAARRNWWSLQPLKDTNTSGGSSFTPTQDSMDGKARSTAIIDGFLDAAIQKAGLTPTAPAPAHVLARRLHFLLTGLPPSPDEVHSFTRLHAQDPKAAVRERTRQLLASPAFGEHWARHWMDLVRYAESHGSEGDPEIPGAYQYRDYLIRAFNADVPLNQLIREHIAGDLLPEPRISSTGVNESRIGPAHLRMCEHGYQPVDTRDDQVQAVDNQIDVVTKAFLGLTVSCARCHDHKFDAISQKDYTALYGIFSSVRPAQVPLDADTHLRVEKKQEIVRLKSIVREELSKVWMEQAGALVQRLEQAVKPPETPDLQTLKRNLDAVELKLSSLQWEQISGGSLRHSPPPFAMWTFATNADDQMGRLHGQLIGGAKVENGALVLDGKGSYLKTPPLPVPVGERTYEAWLRPVNLEQKGGGIVGLEQTSSHAFDSLVLGEKQKAKWLPGSNNFKRTEQPEGAEETPSPHSPVHIAVTYATDGTIAMFRNGVPYGKAYRKSDLYVFPPNDTSLLIGLRHTGAGNGFYEGTIDEIRLHTRVLTPAEIATSFSEGPVQTSMPAVNGAKAGPTENVSLKALSDEAAVLRKRIAELTPSARALAIQAPTKTPEHPLHLAVKAVSLPSAEFRRLVGGYRNKYSSMIAASKEFNHSNFEDVWDCSSNQAPAWFMNGPDVQYIRRGDFRISSEGTEILSGLLPSGIASSAEVPQWGGAAMSPDFKIRTGSVSVRFAATNGAMLRVIPDNYPLGMNSIFPRAVVQRTQSLWTRLDTSYRLHAQAYLEFTTPPHQTRRTEPPKGSDKIAGDPFFLAERVVFHEGTEPPREVHPALELILERCTDTAPEKFLEQLQACIFDAIQAWKDLSLSEAQRELLTTSLQSGLLTADATASPRLTAAVESCRKTMKSMPQPVFAPGVLEHQGKDAAFLPRGDYKKPGEPVPRAFLEVLNPQPIESRQSGRLELSERLLDASNPLPSRVMANRIWLWMFGEGIVATPDNFGRMGEQPSHPELLDFLAKELQANQWSLKRSLITLTQTEAFARSSSASEASQQIDPRNIYLSRGAVRRLNAESIRDAMLSVSGSLDRTQQGPPVRPEALRRSVYLQLKRNNLPAFLSTFDAPRPFTTLGRRDSTTVPAQSLVLLNDPAVVQMARRWSEAVRKSAADQLSQVTALFETGLGRPPSAGELMHAQALLAESATEGDLTPLAHAIFNLKEFIYLR